jgi:hypothetical protein
MNLLEIQRQVAAAVMQPLTAEQRRRRGVHAEADAIIRPNARLNSFERLEIYNRQYWFRLLTSFAEDFPGLQALVGRRRFDRIARSYLSDCPSTSFTLRNLGSRLEKWLRDHPALAGERQELALDMVRLEWAHIEAFDSPAREPLSSADLASDSISLALQPHLRLLDLQFPVDEILIKLKHDSSRIGKAQRQARPVFIAVHRVDGSVYYKRIIAEEFRLLSALQSGRSLDISIDAAFANSSLSQAEFASMLQSAFAHWAELGWFCGASA